MAAFAQFQAGQLAQAEAACAALLADFPAQPDTLHLLAIVRNRQGKRDEALALVTQALQATPQNDSMHATLGHVLLGLNRLDEAQASLRRSIVLNPQAALVHAHLGSALLAAGQGEAAQPCFERALALDARLALAHNGLGLVLLQQHRAAQALARFAQADALEPGSCEVQLNLGLACARLQRFDAAQAHLEQALRLDPRHVAALDALAELRFNDNRIDQAVQLYAQAQTLSPAPWRHLRQRLMLPQIYASAADLHAHRLRFEQAVDELLAEGHRDVPFDLALYAPSIFSLAYHGLDNRALLQRMARLYRTMVPELSWAAPHTARPRQTGTPLRVGFFSVHVHDHPVARCFAGVVEALSRAPGLEVRLVTTAAAPPLAQRRVYREFTGAWDTVPTDLRGARAAIAALALDVLVFQDIGMEPLSYFLAFARLARWQCVVGGHPETTGIDTIDSFASSALSEPPEAQTYYSEKLLNMPVGTFRFEHPVLPSQLKGRAELGLPAEGRLYLCPMAMQKLHPDFDAAIDGILAADPQAVVLFVAHPSMPWRRHLEARWDRTIDSARRGRIVVLPWFHDPVDFVALNACAAVVLDPFHFGIGSTGMATFAACTPLVTWPGRFLRGRVGLAYCRMLDIEEGVASSPADYVQRAVRLASDAGLQQRLRERIQRNKPQLFENPQLVDDFQQHLLLLARRLDAAVGPTATDATGLPP